MTLNQYTRITMRNLATHLVFMKPQLKLDELSRVIYKQTELLNCLYCYHSPLKLFSTQAQCHFIHPIYKYLSESDEVAVPGCLSIGGQTTHQSLQAVLQLRAQTATFMSSLQNM